MKILVSGSSFVIENLLVVVKGELMQLDQSFIGIIFFGDGLIIFLQRYQFSTEESKTEDEITKKTKKQR